MSLEPRKGPFSRDERDEMVSIYDQKRKDLLRVLLTEPHSRSSPEPSDTVIGQYG